MTEELNIIRSDSVPSPSSKRALSHVGGSDDHSFPDLWFKLLATILVFLGAIEFFTIFLSLAGVTISSRPAIAISLGALVIAWGYQRLLGPLVQVNHPQNSRRPRAGWPLIVLIALTVIVYGIMWILAYALTDFSFDGLWYHIPAMHFWAFKGGIHWITADPSAFWDPFINNCYNGFPKGAELISFLFIQATGVTRLLNSTNLLFLPLGSLAIFSLARFIGASGRFALLVGLLFMFVPINIAQGPTTYVDVAAASCYVSLFAMLTFTLNRICEGKIPWRLLLPLGCSLGLAMSVKTPGIIFLPLVIIILAAGFIISRYRARSPGVSFPAGREVVRNVPSLHRLRVLVWFIFLTILVGVAVGGYWPIRNYIHTGNPINPVGITIAGRTIFPDYAWDTQFHAPYAPGTEEWSQARRILYNWMEGMENWRWAKTSYGSLRGGLGLLWLLGCVPAIIYMISAAFIKWWKNRDTCRIAPISPFRIFTLLIPVALLLFFAMPPHHNHIARYTIWLYGLGLPCFAVIGQKSWNYRLRSVRLGARIWFVIVILLLIIEGVITLHIELGMASFRRDEEQVSAGMINCLARSVREDYPTGYKEGSLMDKVLRGNAAVALGPLEGDRRLLLGRLIQDRNFGKRRIYFLDHGITGDRDKLRQYLKERNVRYVIWNPDIGIPPPLKNLSLLWEYAPGGFYLLAYNFSLSPEAEELP
jgi:hypothetical protein